MIEEESKRKFGGERNEKKKKMFEKYFLNDLKKISKFIKKFLVWSKARKLRAPGYQRWLKFPSLRLV